MKDRVALPIGAKQILLSFDEERQNYPRGTTLQTTVMRPFLPRGLFLWGATDATVVTRLQLGNLIDGDAGIESRIPGRYFAAGKSFAALSELALVGELEGACEPRQILDVVQADPGMRVRLDIEGPYEQACLWGLTRDLGLVPPRRARIESATVSGPLRPEEAREVRFVGEVIENGLAGEKIIFEAVGPSAEVVATLIAAFAAQDRRH